MKLTRYDSQVGNQKQTGVQQPVSDNFCKEPKNRVVFQMFVIFCQKNKH